MAKKKNEIVEKKETAGLDVLNTGGDFSKAMEIAERLSKSDLIPQAYKQKPENCLLALELSSRMKMPVFAIMQNMYVIQGKPSWSSSFIIACINASGRFRGGLRFEMDAAKTKCRAYAVEKSTGEKMSGPTISLEMARSEGWLAKNGSKWKTMPELMLRYRAASFFGKLYCPEIMNGMQTAEETEDYTQAASVEVTDVFADEPASEPSKTADDTPQITAPASAAESGAVDESIPDITAEELEQMELSFT